MKHNYKSPGEISEVKTYFWAILLLTFSCQNSPHKPYISKNSNDRIHAVREKNAQLVPVKPEEFFGDSTNIGRKCLNKFELSKYKIADSVYVIIKFYSRNAQGWSLKNEFHLANDGLLACDPKIADFNNDGLNDVTYVSAVAGRGANEIRRLFIYDKTGDQLIYLKNSDNYPNLLYNKDLNCIDAFLVYGGCSTVFLKISGDSLKEFASVELDHGLTVRTIGENNNERIIFRDKSDKNNYVRYKNFKPLMEYDDY